MNLGGLCWIRINGKYYCLLFILYPISLKKSRKASDNASEKTFLRFSGFETNR